MAKFNGKCCGGLCGCEIAIKTHIGGFIPNNLYRNAYLVMKNVEKGYESRMRFSCCVDCLKTMKAQEIYDYYKSMGDINIAEYDSLGMLPTDIEEARSK